MDVKFSAAAEAYTQAAAKVAPGIGGSAPTGAQPSGSEFSGLVNDIVGDAVSAGRKAEVMSLQAVSAPTDISQVALAVTNAEVTMQTVVAVRDRVIQAYQDIIKMPI